MKSPEALKLQQRIETIRTRVFRPDRSRLAPALELSRRVQGTAALWEQLFAMELLPETWLHDRDRRFAFPLERGRLTRAMRDIREHQRVTLVGELARGHRFASYHPAGSTWAALVACDTVGMHTAEQIAREFLVRMSFWNRPFATKLRSQIERGPLPTVWVPRRRPLPQQSHWFDPLVVGTSVLLRARSVLSGYWQQMRAREAQRTWVPTTQLQKNREIMSVLDFEFSSRIVGDAAVWQMLVAQHGKSSLDELFQDVEDPTRPREPPEQIDPVLFSTPIDQIPDPFSALVSLLETGYFIRGFDQDGLVLAFPDLTVQQARALNSGTGL